MSTHQRAVAVKESVLPTYIGSRKTLKGNLETEDFRIQGYGCRDIGRCEEKKNWQTARKGNENEPVNSMVHQNAKVIAQKRAGDAKRPCRRDNENLTQEEERDWDDRRQRFWQDLPVGLICQGKMIAVKTRQSGESSQLVRLTVGPSRYQRKR